MATIKSKNGLYKLVLPTGYTSFEEDDVLYIYDDDRGVRVLEIHNYHCPVDYSFIIEDELKVFMESIDDSKSTENIQITNSYRHSSAEFISRSGDHWKIWVFYKNGYAVFASYHCNNNDMNKETQNVDVIMRSLTISDIAEPDL